MPCLLVIIALAFPRVVIVLLYLFSSFFHGVYQGIIIPVLGFLFLPLTLIVYTYIEKTYHYVQLPQMIALAIAVIVDLGLVSTHRMRSSNV
jgi:hypothetical protein